MMKKENRKPLRKTLYQPRTAGNLIVHVLDALVHGLAHGHNGIVLGVQNGLDIRCVLGVGHFQIDIAGGQCIHRIAVLGGSPRWT